MNKIGVMQGRLVPPEEGKIQRFPRSHWEDEFSLAAQAGFNSIEWIFDETAEDLNPIVNEKGIEKLKGLIKSHNVEIRSICADYFMAYPLVRCASDALKERIGKLEWLIRQGQKLGVTRLVLPFVDASAICTKKEQDQVVKILTGLFPLCEESRVELHLETSLNDQEFKQLLDQLPHSCIKVNYDSGNSASLGYKPSEEFKAYGSRVESVHIKDRLKGGGTVPLSKGDTDFEDLFACLRANKYEGDFIFQVARSESGQELAWAKHNLEFMKPYFQGLHS